MDSLVVEYFNLRAIKDDNIAYGHFQSCLRIYQSAMKTDPVNCSKAIARWVVPTNYAISKFWSVFALQVERCDLSAIDSLHDLNRNIGDITEGFMKPYLIALLEVHQINNAKVMSFESLLSMRLGNVVQQLRCKESLRQMLFPQPWDLPINQWRNIAYHHDARLEGSSVVCTYGEQPKQKEIRLSISEFYEVFAKLYLSSRVLKLAFTIIFLDNITHVAEYLTSERPLSLRAEAAFMSLATALAGQGFEIAQFNESDTCSKLVVKDISQIDPAVRRFHPAQFLYPFWNINHPDKITVVFLEQSGSPDIEFSIDRDTCEQVDRGTIDPREIMSRMSIYDYKTGRRIPGQFPDG